MAEVKVFTIALREQTARISSRHARRVLDEIQDAARINALGGVYSKGRLASSVFRNGPTVVGERVVGSVGSRLDYARWVESGAPVHDIFPKGAPHIYRFGRKRRPLLRFVWRGRLVYMNQIPGGPGTVGRSHPGMRGKHWLSKALLEVGARRRMRVVIYNA